MGKSYRPYLPDQEFLLPPSLHEWTPDNHLVYFVSDVVDNLNLSALDAVYGDEQRGQPHYDPRMMTKVLVYGYCVGVCSSRRIERRLAEGVGLRVLAAGNAPNFRTIADFRKLHLSTLAGLFEEVLRIALEAGALKLGQVALDGTKVKANASKHKAMSYGRMKEREQQLRAEVRELLAQAEAADAAEDAHYGGERRGAEAPAAARRATTPLEQDGGGRQALQDGRAGEAGAPIEDDIATGKQKDDEYRQPCPRGPLPRNATQVERMKRKLQTKAGRAVYAARKTIVEPVFGQIKQARGFRQFLLRGLAKVRGEWALVCLTHNILKLDRLCNA